MWFLRGFFAGVFLYFGFHYSSELYFASFGGGAFEGCSARTSAQVRDLIAEHKPVQAYDLLDESCRSTRSVQLLQADLAYDPYVAINHYNQLIFGQAENEEPLLLKELELDLAFAHGRASVVSNSATQADEALRLFDSYLAENPDAERATMGKIWMLSQQERTADVRRVCGALWPEATSESVAPVVVPTPAQTPPEIDESTPTEKSPVPDASLNEELSPEELVPETVPQAPAVVEEPLVEEGRPVEETDPAEEQLLSPAQASLSEAVSPNPSEGGDSTPPERDLAHLCQEMAVFAGGGDEPHWWSFVGDDFH